MHSPRIILASQHILQFEKTNLISKPWVKIARTKKRDKVCECTEIHYSKIWFDSTARVRQQIVNYLKIINGKTRCLSNFFSKATSVSISIKWIFFKNRANHLESVWMLTVLCTIEISCFQDMIFCLYLNNAIISILAVNTSFNGFVEKENIARTREVKFCKKIPRKLVQFDERQFLSWALIKTNI